MNMRTLVASMLAASLMGCVSTGERQAHRYYVLEPRAASAAAALRDGKVAVLATTAAAFYETQDIVFSRAPGVRGYYQFNHWTERPNRAIHDELARRIGPANPDSPYLLATHLSEIYHDAADSPGRSRVTVVAQLIERARGTVVAQKTFSREAPATSYDAAGAVRGCDDAVGSLLDELVEWIDKETAVPPTPRRTSRSRAPG